VDDFDDFEIVGPLESIETIASGSGIRDLPRLVKYYGSARWRKLKAVTRVRRLGYIWLVEVHWYEAHGIGKREMKIGRYLD
jgi:hypothetical protein